MPPLLPNAAGVQPTQLVFHQEHDADADAESAAALGAIDSEQTLPEPIERDAKSASAGRPIALPDQLLAPFELLPAAVRDDPKVRGVFAEAWSRTDPVAAQQKADLIAKLGECLPSTVADRDARIEATANALHRVGLKAIDLPGLIATSRIRDALRHWTSVLRSGMSYLPASVAGLGFTVNPPYDKSNFSGDEADDVGERNIYIAYLVGIACMGIGGQVAGRIVEDGQLGPKYNRPAPVLQDGKSVAYADLTRARLAKGFEFYPFSIGHGTVGSGVLELGPERTALAGVLSTLMSSVGTAVSAALVNEALPPKGLDYAWLDASTPEKAKAMERAIEHLREHSVVALGGYAKDAAAGVAGVFAVPGKPALKGAVMRLIAAVIATFPRLFTASTKNEHDKAIYGVLAGAWIGLVWGWLGMALFPPVEPRAAPASRAAVVQVAPPAAQASEPAAPNGADLA